jgi:hypothetical protein
MTEETKNTNFMKNVTISTFIFSVFHKKWGGGDLNPTMKTNVA